VGAMGTMGTTLLGSAAPRDSDRRDITRICPGRQCQAKGPRGQGDQGTNESANLNEADTHQAVGDGDEGQVDVLQGHGGPCWTRVGTGSESRPSSGGHNTRDTRSASRNPRLWPMDLFMLARVRIVHWVEAGAMERRGSPERGGRIEGGGSWVLGVLGAGCWVLGVLIAGLGSGRARGWQKSERARRARRARRTRPARGRWLIARQSQTPWQSQRRPSAGPAQSQTPAQHRGQSQKCRCKKGTQGT
jgi:hypothetical protein